MPAFDLNEYCNLSLPGWPDAFGRSISDDCRREDRESGTAPIRVLSLFAGAGGLDIGFHDAGFDIVESVEMERRFCDTLAINSKPGARLAGNNVVCKDIREYCQDLPAVDFIIGGPPCQTFSAAGRRANGVLGITDSRGILFREYVRILGEIKPKGFLFENVYGIVGAQGGKAWSEIVTAFSDIGYRLHYRVLDAADYGVPQHRERLIIVGLKEGEYRFPRPQFGPDSCSLRPFYTAGNAIAHVKNDDIPDLISGRYADLITEIPPGLNYSFFTEEMGHPRPLFAWRSKFSDFMYKADPEEPVRTIKAQGGQYTGPFHWSGRHFSIAEYKRLQTFPDDYEICGGRGTAIHQIGNAVPPQFARMLALSIRSQVFNRESPVAMETIDDAFELGFRKRKRMLTKKYREKAQVALVSQRACDTRSLKKNYELDFDFDPNTFAIFPQDGGGSCHASYAWGKSLDIEVEEKVEDSGAFELSIVPSKAWSLPVAEIRIVGKGSQERILTIMWKALDHCLATRGLKADLVQLGNYYQYAPAVRCRLDCPEGYDFAETVKAVSSGVATRRMHAAAELASLLGISERNVASAARRLRSMGFEVRNANTNSQIPEGMWLIPYEFPTLTPLSIQLRKEV